MFANFWSIWSLLNLYVTMIHQEVTVSHLFGVRIFEPLVEDSWRASAPNSHQHATDTQTHTQTHTQHTAFPALLCRVGRCALVRARPIQTSRLFLSVLARHVFAWLCARAPLLPLRHSFFFFAWQDGVHRLFYGLHTCMAFIMCVAIEHPSFPFFDFAYQGYFFTICGIISRCLIIVMWLYFLWVDGKMREVPAYAKFLPKYTHEDVKQQVIKHAGTIALANVIFLVTCFMVFDGHPDDSTDRRLASSYSAYGGGCRRLASSYSSYSAYGGGCDDEEEKDYTGVVVLWILAVCIEQAGNAYTCIMDKLPFCGEYAGERMQAWLMLCFGESVIGLLISPIYYDVNSMKSIIVSFIMVFCLVTVYFDVTDADKFLHLFILRNEKWKAFWYILLQWPFSMFVFFVGVALKSINYIEHVAHDLELASGCKHSVEHIRRLDAHMDGLSEKLGGGFGDHFGMLGQHDGSAHGRRLASMTLDEYDELIVKCFNLLCYSALVVQACSIAVAYTMPTDQNMNKVHISRIGSIVAVLVLVVVPPNIASLKTDCLGDYEDSMRRRLTAHRELSSYSSYSSYSAYSSGDDDEAPTADGLTITEGLVVTSLVVFVSFVISLFSIDVDRAFTYKELEDAAHHGREPHLATLSASRPTKSLAERGGVQFVGSAFAGKKSTVVPV